ncbi:MAG TPA: hypothetical protein VN476_13905 [Pyrinomonadaceae bacterium]|nr:hypothetical protein [Pyrinomonadaceae bacterium]
MSWFSSYITPTITGLLALVSVGLIAFVAVGSRFGKTEIFSIAVVVITALAANYLKGFVDRREEKRKR